MKNHSSIILDKLAKMTSRSRATLGGALLSTPGAALGAHKGSKARSALGAGIGSSVGLHAGSLIPMLAGERDPASYLVSGLIGASAGGGLGAFLGHGHSAGHKVRAAASKYEAEAIAKDKIRKVKEGLHKKASKGRKLLGAAAMGGGAVASGKAMHSGLGVLADKMESSRAAHDAASRHLNILGESVKSPAQAIKFNNFIHSFNSAKEHKVDIFNPEHYTNHGLALGGAIAAMHLGHHLMKSKGKMEKKASFNPFEAIVASFIQELG